MKIETSLYKILDIFKIASPQSKEIFMQQSKTIELQKNEIIFTEGKKNQSEYILLSGVVHRYNISEKGENVTTGFYMPDSVITPHFARTNEGKSIFSLQAFTEVVLVEISVKELDYLRHTNLEFHAFGQRVIESECTSSN